MVGYRCRACMWFDKQHKSLSGVNLDLGYCRKHKPVIFQANIGTAGDRYYGAWPLVDVDDLCGEFRANVEQAPQ